MENKAEVVGSVQTQNPSTLEATFGEWLKPDYTKRQNAAAEENAEPVSERENLISQITDSVRSFVARSLGRTNQTEPQTK